MEESVGDWKQFEFQLATESDLPEITQHVRDYFLRSEQMNVYLGWNEEQAADHDRMVTLAISHGLSYVIREKATGELAGVNIVLDTRLPGLESLFSAEQPMCPTLATVLTMIQRLEFAASQAENFHPPAFRADIFITSVADKFRGCGLAKEAYVRMLALLRSRGFPMVQSSFTSPGTRAIAQKLGFQELVRLRFQDQIDENGHKLFPAAGDGPEEFASEAFMFL